MRASFGSRLLAVFLPVLLLAGCTVAPHPLAPAAAGVLVPGDGRMAAGPLGLSWEGDGDFPFVYTAPADGPHPTLEVSIAWARGPDAGAHLLTLTDGAGAMVAEGKAAWFASTVLLPDAPSGTYVAHVEATGAGPDTPAVSGVVQLETPRPPSPDLLLPDLVTLPPTGLRVASPSLAPTWQAAPGCDPYEIVEQAARRCLRFSNAVGNVGDGPLEVRLGTSDAAAGLAGEGRFMQVLHHADGRTEEVPVGGATFHATHGHFHYADFARYELHAWDNGTLGPLLATGHKSGFCFFDTGLSALGLPGTQEPAFARRADCSLPAGRDWVTGLSPNWYDFYRWDLTDQYVDLSGVGDGTYALVAVADGGYTLLESERGNNAAGTAFVLRGDAVLPVDSWTEGVASPSP